MATYQIAYEGKMTGEVGLADVKKNLGALFKMNAAQVEALFSGKPVVIKRDIDEATAKKYAAAFKKAGAVCVITATGQADAAPAATASTAAKPQAAAPAAIPKGDRSGRMAGKDIVNIKVPTALGNLSIGAAGDAIPTLPVDIDVQIPDTGSLSMANDDGYLAPERKQPEAKVDISGLSMEKES